MKPLSFFLFVLALSCNQNSSYLETDVKVEEDSTSEPSFFIADDATLLKPAYQPGKLSGLGFFKIGSSLSRIEALAEQGYKIDSLSSRREQTDYKAITGTRNRKAIVRILPPSSPDSIHELMAQTNWCPNSKVYWLPAYQWEALALSDVYLTYYKDKLVRVCCAPSEALFRAIETKYGKADTTEAGPRKDFPRRIWRNGDLRGGYAPAEGLFFVEVRGVSEFIQYCSDWGLRMARKEEAQSLEEGNNRAEESHTF